MKLKIGMVVESSFNNIKLLINDELLTYKCNKIFEIGTYVVVYEEKCQLSIWNIEEII